MQSLEIKSIFSFFNVLISSYNFKSKLVPEVVSDFIRVCFFLFPINKLTILGEQNFKLGLLSKKNSIFNEEHGIFFIVS